MAPAVPWRARRRARAGARKFSTHRAARAGQPRFPDSTRFQGLPDNSAGPAVSDV
jgi:hypothetical protein